MQDPARFIARMDGRVCPACGTPTTEFARAHVLRRHEVTYWECPACGMVCTDSPHWLTEAYREPIVRSDVGLVSRNLDFARRTAVVIAVLFKGEGPFLDFGGGLGLFVRVMRDAGYDFRWSDPWAENLFARGFEHKAGARYELITAFEVFEHLPQPGPILGELAAMTDTVVFSTELIPPGRPKPGEWWYYAVESGQHVSFYTAEALAALGRRQGMHFHTNGSDFHLLTRRRLAPRLFRLLTGPRSVLGRVLRKFAGSRPSLLPGDHESMLRGTGAG